MRQSTDSSWYRHSTYNCYSSVETQSAKKGVNCANATYGILCFNWDEFGITKTPDSNDSNPMSISLNNYTFTAIISLITYKHVVHYNCH